MASSAKSATAAMANSKRDGRGIGVLQGCSAQRLRAAPRWISIAPIAASARATVSAARNAACSRFEPRIAAAVAAASGTRADGRGSVAPEMARDARGPASTSSGGVSSAQRGCAYGQRVRKRQPDGGSHRARHVAREQDALAPERGLRHRDRGQQRLRVRMARRGEERALVGVLDDASRGTSPRRASRCASPPRGRAR